MNEHRRRPNRLFEILSMSSVAVAAVSFMVWLPRPAIPLIDGDVWWHIRAGEEVLDTGRIPHVDTWSIVGAGKDWTSQDWLSNIVLALGFRLGENGPTVLSLLFSLMAVAALVLLWWASRRRASGTGWLSPLIWLTIGLTVAGPTLGVRVQVVDLPLAAAALAVMWSYLARRRPVALLWLPLIALAWANLHAGWLLLFLLGGAVVVGEATDRAVGRRSESGPLTWKQIGWLAGALIGSLAAISLNPNGAELYLYPLVTSSIQAHRDFLAEWSAPDLSTLTGQLFAGFVAIGVLPTLVFAWKRMRTADVLILVGLTVMAATAARFLLVAGPIGAAIVAIGLGPVISRTRAGKAMEPVLTRMAAPPRTRRIGLVNLSLAVVISLTGVFVAAARVSPGAQHEAISQHMPVAAVDWIVANSPGVRPFNTYSWGGYLGLRRPDAPVYIDGRSDIYGDEPIRRYADAISLRTDPAVILDEHEIDYVLFNTDHPFADWLNESESWDRAYTDAQASVWVRRP